jgi:hypothetical protein
MARITGKSTGRPLSEVASHSGVHRRFLLSSGGTGRWSRWRCPRSATRRRWTAGEGADWDGIEDCQIQEWWGREGCVRVGEED